MLPTALPYVAVLRSPDPARAQREGAPALATWLRAALAERSIYLRPEGVIEFGDVARSRGRVPIGDYALVPPSTLALWGRSAPTLVASHPCPYLGPVTGALAFSLWAPELDAAARDALALALLRVGQGTLFRARDGHLIQAVQRRRFALAEAVGATGLAHGTALLTQERGAYVGYVLTQVAQALRGAGLGPAQGATLRWLMDGANPLRLELAATAGGQTATVECSAALRALGREGGRLPAPAALQQSTVSLWAFDREALEPGVAGRLLIGPPSVRALGHAHPSQRVA